MKFSGFLKPKKLILGLMILLISGFAFSQTNEVYTKVGSDVLTKAPVEGSDVVFGGLYSDTGTTLIFENFWVDGRIGLAVYSIDEWDSVNFGVLDEITHINAGFAAPGNSELVIGTDYDRTIPGAYMYAYDDVLPDARYGNTGVTYTFSWLKPLIGLTIAGNIPFQDFMFSDVNGLEVNGAIYYESDFGINVGTTMYGDFKDSFSIGAYVTGGVDSVFSWLLGYTYNGTGVTGLIPADHYFDGSMSFDFGMFDMAADFELGLDGVNSSNPLYAGLLASFTPFPAMTAQVGVKMNVADSKNYSDSYKAFSVNPKVLFNMESAEIGVGAEIVMADYPVVGAATGFSIPVHFKYWF
ncbi:MAG: hypothetical protein J6B81_00965 [Spirochaetaceae bacterium]|nr:hypothetical protein [Spirochaetaceae bacterium]